MIQFAGLFIIAEAIMYNLILNVWYTAWDFVSLDKLVTPIVGVVALVGAVFFLRHWWKTRGQNAFVCEVTDDTQKQTLFTRMQKIAAGPMTVAAVFGIIALALSVNIIEFACSIGIPQAYTKILELNDPSMIMRQIYLAIYTFFYMIDDFIVFALALWGFDRLHHTGTKYANLSALIGGVALLLLGLLLLFAPQLLIWG